MRITKFGVALSVFLGLWFPSAAAAYDPQEKSLSELEADLVAGRTTSV